MNTSPTGPPFWWYAKGVLGLCLIVNAIVAAARSSLVSSPAAQQLAVTMVLIGGACELYHYVLLKRQRGDLARPDRLRTRGGLFRWVRHPMYFGDALMYAGFIAMAASIAGIVIGAFAMLSLFMLARAEDKQMATRFGAQHRAWRERTGLLLPPWPRQR